MPETSSGELELRALAAKSEEEIYKTLKTRRFGLTYREALERTKTYGRNEFGGKKKTIPLILFLSQFKSPLLLLLIAAAAVSGFLGSVVNFVIILAIVIASAFIDFLNTYKSERAAAKLQERVRVTSGVWRDEKLAERDVREVVPGDVFSLEAGDTVPADAVLVQGKDVFAAEGILTGESMPVEKNIEGPAVRRILYMGMSIVSGRGVAVAVHTGTKTKLGDVKKGLDQAEKESEFDTNIKSFNLFIFRITLFLVLAIIFINLLFERKNPLDIFLFAIAIAVGITPELLPLIITTNLAQGALRMSKKGVIVKRLSAIHTLGSVDVICTDKTGTLTEDKITLVKYVDASGAESDNVLFWGYAGSVHHTGVGTTLDRAITERKTFDMREWKKVDEVPFDHERKRDSVAVSDGTQITLIVKGAPEEVIRASRFYGDVHTVLGAELIHEISGLYKSLSEDGFRVLAVAIKDLRGRQSYVKEDEAHLVFLGFLAFLDPPKRGVKQTLERLTEHNIGIKIITGDNAFVSEKIAKEINLHIHGVLAGEEVERLDDTALEAHVEKVNLFTRASPREKQRIIAALQRNGHVVGYLGDGVNDALSLKEADVGISVNNAVDIAKETADIILLRKGLHEVIEGIIEGRKNFANTFKYLMMVLSSNFGNMFIMPLASFFLPFLPMTPTQILLNNFLYDSSQLATPFDEVDKEFLKRPKKFDITFMKKFMLVFGPLSSVFDLATFVILMSLRLSPAAFQTGWFLESIATQTLVVLVFRTRENVLKSRVHPFIAVSSIGVVVLAWILPFTRINIFFGFTPLGAGVLGLIAGVVALYLVTTEAAKKYFYRRYGTLIEK